MKLESNEYEEGVVDVSETMKYRPVAQLYKYERIIAGNHIYETCCWCGKYVRMTGVFGSLHFCNDNNPQVRAARRRNET